MTTPFYLLLPISLDKKSRRLKYDYLDKNYVLFDNKNKKLLKNYILIDKIKNNSKNLLQVFGIPHIIKKNKKIYKFKIDKSKFILENNNNIWYAKTNSKNESIIQYFLDFIKESYKATHSLRSTHKKYQYLIKIHIC